MGLEFFSFYCVFFSIETKNIDLVDTANVATPHPTVCVNYTNEDCMAKFGEQAFCRNEKCYCDRGFSFINNGKCGMSDFFLRLRDLRTIEYTLKNI
jgi:hypothetical protein